MLDTPDSFYVWVSSNSPSPSGEQNKPHDFSVNVPHNDQLKGNWEVALTEIDYPVSNQRLMVMNNAKVNYVKYLVNGSRKPKSYSEVNVDAGKYYDVEHISNSFKSFFAERFPIPDEALFKNMEVKIVPDAQGTRVVMTINEGAYDLLETLGYHFDKREQVVTSFRFPLSSSLKVIPRALFIYCDFIEFQYVGNQIKPLLRFVPIPPNQPWAKRIHQEFQNRIYLNVAQGYIKRMSFKILDEDGVPVYFQKEHVRLLLHFRVKQVQ